MNRKALVKIALVVGVTGMTLSYQACSRVSGQAGSSPNSKFNSGSNMNGGTTTDNPKPTVSVLIANSSGNATGSAQLCLGEIRFSGANAGATASANSSTNWGMSGFHQPTDFYSMEETNKFLEAMWQYTESLMGMNFTVLPQGNFVKSIPLTPGTYTDVDLTLDQNCSYGSLSVPTAGGVLEFQDPLVLHFVGNINLAKPGQVVLNIGGILDALANAKSATDVKAILATVTGTF